MTCSRRGYLLSMELSVGNVRNQVVSRVFPAGCVVKNLPASAGDMGSIPHLGRSPGGGDSNPLQYSCLGSPVDRGAWPGTVRGVAESDMT